MSKVLSFLPSLGFVILLSLTLTSCASKKDNIKNKQSNLYFGAGTQSLMEHQYTEALKSLLKANELTPGSSEILNNLGMAYYFKEEKDMAVKTLKEALKCDKNNSDAWVNLASIYYEQGDVAQAEKIYKNVLKDLTYDKQARTLYNLGIIELKNKRDVRTAEAYFKKSVKEDENYCPSYLQLGLIQFQRRRFNTALKNFKDASMGTCYELPAPVYYQAITLIEMKRHGEARIKLDEIETRFAKSAYAGKARTKILELNNLEKETGTLGTQASRTVLESPDF